MGKKQKKEKQSEDALSDEIHFKPDSENEVPYVISLYGKVEEEECAEIIHALYTQKLACEKKIRKPKAIKFIISTHGGDAVEMFSLYDMIKYVQKIYPIHTIGMGKVMSAGTLLLASGNKGKRKIGSNCRVMLHNVKGAPPQPDCYNVLKKEIKEIEWFQERYISAMVKETRLTDEELREVMTSRQNVYLSAEEAVQCGIADKIV
tara:strand:- start:67 stop:681 length:615 start_codon:yes stop_codon:yes gene_type:complete